MTDEFSSLIPAAVLPEVAADLSRFTPEQRAVVRALLETPEHLVVMSTAGSGKSTLLRVLACLLPEGRNAVLAFNVSIAEEIAPRMPQGVLVSPLHKLGFRLLREARGELTVSPFKRRNLVGAFLKARGLTGDLSGLTQVCERALMELTPASEEELLALAARLGVAVPRGLSLLALVREVSGASLALFRERGLVDFTDMLHVPLKLGLGRGVLDHALVDEAQDLSRLQLRFVRHLAGEGGRLILVGDERQALYSFSGADVGGLSRAVGELPARLLKLTVTFRCPRSHVALASRFSPGIVAAEGASEGEVRELGLEEALELTRPGDLVMARLNAPLVRFALRLFERGVPVTLLGHDLGKGLMELARASLGERFTAAEVEGRVLACGEARLAGHLRRGLSGAALARLAGEDADRLACLAALALQVAGGGEGQLSELSALIARLSAPQVGAVRLCTVHRAKGLEAGRALLLEAGGLLEGDAEPAVSFVALTRAKESLWLVGA